MVRFILLLMMNSDGLGRGDDLLTAERTFLRSARLLKRYTKASEIGGLVQRYCAIVDTFAEL
jgi:hypothetical protein